MIKCDHLSYAVLGLGQTGLSCAKCLTAQGHQVRVYDDRINPPCLEALREYDSSIAVHLGDFHEGDIADADVVVVSPGLPPHTPIIQAVKARGQTLISDLDLFAQSTTSKYMLVTGTNGKSTVATLLGQMLTAAGWRVRVGGNIGLPAPECLEEDVDWVVLECSSFSLYYTHHLKAHAGVVLNVASDHLDWHQNLDAYYAAKQRVYTDTQYAICAVDLPRSAQIEHIDATHRVTFGQAASADWTISPSGGIEHEGNVVINACDFKLPGLAIKANVAAACAMAHTAEVLPDAMRRVTQQFQGLPHRCEHLGCYEGVDWYDDSKATNLAATLSAVNTYTEHYKSGLILLLGGQLKDEAWAPAITAFSQQGLYCIVFGDAAEHLSSLLSACRAKHEVASTLKMAVSMAHRVVQADQAVLFAPGGASFDEFSNFKQRGHAFRQYVYALMGSDVE